jgi:hypothetical protein
VVMKFLLASVKELVPDRAAGTSKRAMKISI